MEQTNKTCVLCESEKTYVIPECDKYVHCTVCDLRFLFPHHRLSMSDEKDRYLLHNNDVNDSRYQDFVRPLYNEIVTRAPKKSLGLDYGAGPGPVLTKLLTDSDYKIKLYDPAFLNTPFPTHEPLDFIFASESAEHFFSPKKEFLQMKSALKKDGFIAIMTSLFTEKIVFSQWHYRKDPTHVCFYSENTFAWLKTELQFKKLDVVFPRIAILSL